MNTRQTQTHRYVSYQPLKVMSQATVRRLSCLTDKHVTRHSSMTHDNMSYIDSGGDGDIYTYSDEKSLTNADIFQLKFGLLTFDLD